MFFYEKNANFRHDETTYDGIPAAGIVIDLELINSMDKFIIYTVILLSIMDLRADF